MNTRAKDTPLPNTILCDMRKELEEGNRSILSYELQKQISINLENKEQTMLFLNRRGYSTFVSCRKCGHVMKCAHCDVSYTYHVNNFVESLSCHYCGETIDNPQICPQCGSKYIKYFGSGTQKLEAEIKKQFPNAKIMRMDSDTTKGKYSHQELLSAFSRGEADILIGTQMIAKGHDFKNLSLVGIIAADLSLNTGDFRAAENTFSLLTQVAGRAGRSETQGRVVIQSYEPEHYSILHAIKHDYLGFYNEEIQIRKAMEYPPFSSICMISALCKDEKQCIDAMNFLKDILLGYNNGLFSILGPSPAVISKLKDEYRWKIIVKSDKENALLDFVRKSYLHYKNEKRFTQVLVNVVMNPNFII